MDVVHRTGFDNTIVSSITNLNPESVKYIGIAVGLSRRLPYNRSPTASSWNFQRTGQSHYMRQKYCGVWCSQGVLMMNVNAHLPVWDADLLIWVITVKETYYINYICCSHQHTHPRKWTTTGRAAQLSGVTFFNSDNVYYTHAERLGSYPIFFTPQTSCCTCHQPLIGKARLFLLEHSHPLTLHFLASIPVVIFPEVAIRTAQADKAKQVIAAVVSACLCSRNVMSTELPAHLLNNCVTSQYDLTNCPLLAYPQAKLPPSTLATLTSLEANHPLLKSAVDSLTTKLITAARFVLLSDRLLLK